MLTNFDYNGKLITRRDDGMYNLTQMCQANGKKINDFLRLKSTKDYIKQLESETGFVASQLLIVKKGNCQHWEQGAWGQANSVLRIKAKAIAS